MLGGQRKQCTSAVRHCRTKSIRDNGRVAGLSFSPAGHASRACRSTRPRPASLSFGQLHRVSTSTVGRRWRHSIAPESDSAPKKHRQAVVSAHGEAPRQGATLMVVCPNGHENRDNQRFCGQCGARLQAADAPASAAQGSIDNLDYRPAVIAAIAASVGVMIGSVSQWVTAGMFSVDGLSSGSWGTTALILGAASCAVMLTELFWPRTPFNPHWAVPLAWVVAVAGVTCVTYAVPGLIRIMTLPKASFFGIPVGAEVGWGLWLLAFSSMALCVAASIVATRVARSVHLRSSTAWTSGWRSAAIVASAAVAISGVVYYSVNWRDGSGGREATPTGLPSFPNSPSFPNFPSFPDSSTTLEQPATPSTPEEPNTSTTSQVPSLPGTDRQGFVESYAHCEPGSTPALMARTTKSLVVVCGAGPGSYYYRGVREIDGATIELANASAHPAGSTSPTHLTERGIDCGPAH
jgi:hypothetical protein